MALHRRVKQNIFFGRVHPFRSCGTENSGFWKIDTHPYDTHPYSHYALDMTSLTMILAESDFNGMVIIKVTPRKRVGLAFMSLVQPLDNTRHTFRPGVHKLVMVKNPGSPTNKVLQEQHRLMPLFWFWIFGLEHFKRKRAPFGVLVLLCAWPMQGVGPRGQVEGGKFPVIGIVIKQELPWSRPSKRMLTNMFYLFTVYLCSCSSKGFTT